jgi:AraC family transcriptional regulator of adaptative response/methylated-DNA-[protein]-cysteine methyltransferase
MPVVSINKATEDVVNDAERRWQAVVSRDKTADGTFFYSVKTTGVYCRPSCGARLALRENVAFHQSPAEAEDAGFRACKRCKPDQLSPAEKQAQLIAEICRVIEVADTMPSLEELASQAGLSTYHFHRLFKSLTGVTPKAYGAAQRAKRMRSALTNSDSVTDAIYDAGYNSSGRFYEKSNGLLGMTPTQFRDGGTNADIWCATAQSSLGAVLVASSSVGICAIFIGDDAETLRDDLRDRFPRANIMNGDDNYSNTVAQVVAFVEQPQLGLTLPLDIRGTAFQQRVWEALRKIPAGATVTYSDIAMAIGAPNSVRAVASACAANPIAVAIPCHRVVRTDGGLSGYRWGGIERKRKLINREKNGSAGA